MDLLEFHRRVFQDHRLEWLGVTLGAKAEQDRIIIGFNGEGSWQKARFEFIPDAIKENDWSELESVLTGVRPPSIMTHLTRIVGYYSQIQNWNGSKLAELRDRHRGNYLVPGDQAEGDGDVESRARAETHATAGEPAGV